MLINVGVIIRVKSYVCWLIQIDNYAPQIIMFARHPRFVHNTSKKGERNLLFSTSTYDQRSATFNYASATLS